MSSISYGTLVNFIVLLGIFACSAVAKIPKDALVDIKIELAHILIPLICFSILLITKLRAYKSTFRENHRTYDDIIDVST